LNHYTLNHLDLIRLSKKFKSGSAGLQDVVRVYQVVIKLPSLLEDIRGHVEGNILFEAWFGKKLERDIGSLDMLIELVRETIDLDAVDNHQYNVLPGFNEELTGK
jgi:DNA mismatch repair protein MSH2